MYLPENDAQMHDILVELRLYAAMNRLYGLVDELDDAIMLLEMESRRAASRNPELDRTAKDRS